MFTKFKNLRKYDCETTNFKSNNKKKHPTTEWDKKGIEKSTHILHQQVELVDVAELLQLLECEAQVARRLIHQCFHGDQVITQELQPGDVALLSQAHQRQGAVHLSASKKEIFRKP